MAKQIIKEQEGETGITYPFGTCEFTLWVLWVSCCAILNFLCAVSSIIVFVLALLLPCCLIVLIVVEI
jgi:hypothetical protein